MDVRDLIRQIGEREPLNPYQAAGMSAVIRNSGAQLRAGTTLDADRLERVLMVLDRTGEEAASYLVDVREQDSHLTLFVRFPGEVLKSLIHLTSFEGRRQAIKENLIPVLEDIPNWLDLVRVLSRYSMERDDSAMGEHRGPVMEIVLGFLFAAIRQPFDPQARSEGEYALSRLMESILKTSDRTSLSAYLPFVEKGLDFLGSDCFNTAGNSFERRMLEVSNIRSALTSRSDSVHDRLLRRLNLLTAQALLTALDEINPCPGNLVDGLQTALFENSFPRRDQFRSDVLERIRMYSAGEIEARRKLYTAMLEGSEQLDEERLKDGAQFVKRLADQWRDVIRVFLDMIDSVPVKVQAAFAEVLAVQILEIDKAEVKELLIEGLCRIVVRLEKSVKRASRDLVDTFADLFLKHAYSSQDGGKAVSSLKAVEALGVTLGRSGYQSLAEALVDQLLRRPLIRPRETRFTIEDDDTGEPLVLAEDAGANEAHAQHIKSLIAIIASNPRVMHRLIPYLIVQIEIGGTRLCDEDLIQYGISCLLRSNASVTHFRIRTLIKALPYSFKDIGPLDTLRLTAAGLAKELANRGIKPIGNFLGKLRGDIHWRGSIENFYFCQGIVKYFASGNREAISEWMPKESMPYLSLDCWCSDTEAQGLMDLSRRILADHKINPADSESMMGLVSVDTSLYRDDQAWPEFSRRMVLDMIDLVKGLYHKYFIVRQSASGSTVQDDLERLYQIMEERRKIKEDLLVPDVRDPLPKPVTLTEGMEDYLKQIAEINEERPGTPIILRAKKAGHAYAQKATYMEPRFEAFNRDLGLEALQETLATSINNTHFEEITAENLPQALAFLDHLVRGISVNGHSSWYLLRTARDLMLAGRLSLTFDKVRDLLTALKKELDDVHAFYRGLFEEPFDNLLAAHPMDKVPRKLRDLTTLKQIPDTDFFRNYLKTLYVSDLQARDGNLRVLETFIDKLELFLNQRLAESSRLVEPGGADRADPIPFYFPGQARISPCRIGLKAALLRFAENTPPYFVITTDQNFRTSEEMLSDAEFREGVARSLEKLGKMWSRSLGDPANPALFSVRSGSRISMPGMMTTITNVGINDEIADSLAKKLGPWFAYDCYRRFLQEFSQAAFGIERDEFQALIDERKARFNVVRKAHMSGDQMKSLAFDYKKRVAELAPSVVDLLDAGRFLDILIHCAVVVLRSFESQAARKYREAARIYANWQTPVIVQAMVYGNMEQGSSGTGVVSYNPYTLDLRGEFSMGDQGTDVVDGKVVTIPVHDPWNPRETLASHMPEVWKELSSILFRTGERLHFDTRLEYTIEKGKVFVLQIRKDRERKERIPSLKSLGYRVIAQGTGVSGKIFRGIMVTDRNQIAPFRHINKAQSIIDAMNESLPESERLDGFIFVVNDPIPEEIMEEVFSLPVTTALLSRLGGRGAHAADIAKSLDKVHVAQARQIVKFAGKPETVRFGDLDVVVGSKMIIHGQTGEVGLYGRTREPRRLAGTGEDGRES